jgi:hypothetical protein
MAQFAKASADLKGVFHFDVESHVNDAIVFTGLIASGTTITVTNASSVAFVAGQVVRGQGITAGTKVVSYAAGTLTVTGPSALTASSTAVSMTALTMVTVGETVQPQGPKLDFFTLTIVDSAYEQAMQSLQQLATVHLYKAASATSLHVAVYPVGAWSTATLVSASGGIITAAAAGATFGV